MNPATHDRDTCTMTDRNPFGGVILLEKCGPAFPVPMSTDALTACGQVLDAMAVRKVWADAMPAWDRLLAALGYRFPAVPLQLHATQHADVLMSIIVAMANTGGRCAEIKWRHADAAMRGWALLLATQHETEQDRLTREAFENEREHDPAVRAEVFAVRDKAVALRAWSEGWR